MTKYIDSEAALRDWPLCDEPGDAYQFIKNFPAADVVARDCYNRVLKENDIMREQLAKIGKKPGDSMDNVRPVVRAEWMDENTRPRSSQFYCAACHRTAYDPQPTRSKGWVKRCRYAFCPNCGADMREVTT